MWLAERRYATLGAPSWFPQILTTGVRHEQIPLNGHRRDRRYRGRRRHCVCAVDKHESGHGRRQHHDTGQPVDHQPNRPEQVGSIDFAKHDYISEHDVAEHDFSKHDFAEHDFTQHDVTEHHFAEHDKPEHDVTEHDQPERYHHSQHVAEHQSFGPDEQR